MKVIDSLYPGKCWVCQENWYEGELIAFDSEAADEIKPEGRWVHENCHSGS